MKNFHVSASLSILGITCPFNYSHCSEGKEIPNCGFNFYFSMCLWSFVYIVMVICIYAWKKYLFKFFAYSVIGLSLYYWVVRVLFLVHIIRYRICSHVPNEISSVRQNCEVFHSYGLLLSKQKPYSIILVLGVEIIISWNNMPMLSSKLGFGNQGTHIFWASIPGVEILSCIWGLIKGKGTKSSLLYFFGIEFL